MSPLPLPCFEMNSNIPEILVKTVCSLSSSQADLSLPLLLLQYVTPSERVVSSTYIITLARWWQNKIANSFLLWFPLPIFSLNSIILCGTQNGFTDQSSIGTCLPRSLLNRFRIISPFAKYILLSFTSCCVFVLLWNFVVVVARSGSLGKEGASGLNGCSIRAQLQDTTTQPMRTICGQKACASFNRHNITNTKKSLNTITALSTSTYVPDLIPQLVPLWNSPSTSSVIISFRLLLLLLSNFNHF